VRDAARESIAEYADLAVPKLRESYGLLTGEAPPLDWPTPWLRQKLFEVMDRIRLEDVDARVHEGLTALNEGRLADAVADFDDVLARQPDWDRKAEMVPAYVFYAQSVAGAARPAARTNFEKALQLDPNGPRRAQIESALAVLEGKDLHDRGVNDEEPFRRALKLDPGNAKAQAEIARIEEAEVGRDQRWRRRVIEGSGALVLLCGLILFVGPRRRRQRRPA
jgi:Tfp pilus assembly protein PilF